MAYITPIGFDPAQIDYWLGQQYGCNAPGTHDRRFSYHTDSRERGLTWIGRGLAEVGIQAGTELTPDQFPMARALIDGTHPRTGEVLVEPKQAIHDDAKVPTAPLLRAIRAVADEANVPVAEVLGNPSMLKKFATAQRAVASKGEGARLRADQAGQLADAAGLNAEQVWGQHVFERAAANLFEIHTATKADGTKHEVRRPRRRTVGNGGYGLTLTLPKSLTMLPAFAQPELAAHFEQIYLQQVERTFDWLEATTAYGMRGKHGDGKSAEIMPGTGFLGWTMVHRAARPIDSAEVGDPHWHMHVTLANMTRGLDGKWSTVASGGRDLMRHAPATDRILQALIRHQLSTQFGIRFTWNQRTTKWEVAGIPDATLQQFSKRNSDIRDTLIALGYDPRSATRAQQRVAEQRTRNPKGEYVDAADATLQDIWQAEEVAAGRDPAEHMRRVLAGGHTPDDPGEPAPDPVVTAASIAESLLDPDIGLTAHSRRFTRADALWRVADAMPNGYASPAEIEAMTDQVLARLGFIRLPARVARELLNHTGARKLLSAAHMRNAQSYTTDDVIDAEKIILRAAMASHPEQSPVRVTDPDHIELAIGAVEATQRYTLSQEQHHALQRLVTTGRMIDTVEGAPGTGKTTLMRALRVVLESAGYVVAGAATAAVAALNLQNESGIRSRTVAYYLGRIADEDPTVLAGVDALILDEANLTNDRDRAQLYQRAAQTGTRIIEIGDSHQLRGVGVGSLFGRVHELVDGAVLRDNRRQVHEDEREAIAAWREARYAEALTIWAGKGRLVATETSTEAAAAMLSTWWEQRQNAPDPHTEIRGLVMLAATNLMVRRLNDAAQALRLNEGELGEGRTYSLAAGGTQRIHVGDHILLRTNAYRRPDLADIDVLNGYRAVVRHIDDDGTITADWQQEDADGIQTHTARLAPKYVAIGGVDLGYSLTIHKSEGLTVKDQWGGPDGDKFGGTVLFAAAGADNPGAHVASSRHLDSVWWFTAREELETDQDTALRGVPVSRGERTDRAVEKLAERARATETSPDDLPVVVQLGLPEFQTQADPDQLAAEREAHAQHERDAQGARREADRRREERAERTDQRRRARAERQAEGDRRQAATAALLREVWRHEPDLVEQIVAGSAFGTVARALEDVENSALNVREVLAEIRLDTVASDEINDKARFTSWSIRDAAERIVTGQAAQERERASQRAEAEQARDQAGDLLREAWSTRPELAEQVITSPAFDTVVRELERHMQSGFDPRELLAKVPLGKVDADGIRDKARFTAYSLHRVVEREQERIDREQQAADRAAAERYRRRITAEYLREAWPQHAELVECVIAGPAFGALAQKVEQALDAEVDIPSALTAVAPTDVSARRVRNPSAYTASAFERAAQHQIEQRDLGTNTAAAAVEPAPACTPAPRWTERAYGRLDDDTLHNLISAEQQRTELLAAERVAATQTATHLREEADAETGPEVRALEANLVQLRAQAAAVREINHLETSWNDAINRAKTAAAARGHLEHDIDGLGRLTRSSRAELTERIDQLRQVEDQAQGEALEVAKRAALLQEHTGPRGQRRQIETRANAAKADYDHARSVAVRRDLEGAASAERRAARAAELQDNQAEKVIELQAEAQLRQQLPAAERELEQRERVLEPAPSMSGHSQHGLTLEATHQPHVDDAEYQPDAQIEIEPQQPEL